MLLHSIIPHKHTNELGDTTKDDIYSEADGIVDYIKLMFLTDLGEGHMETFDQGKDIDLNVDFQFDITPNVAFIGPKIAFQVLDNNNFAYNANYNDGIPIISRYFLSNINFRGPPILS